MRRKDLSEFRLPHLLTDEELKNCSRERLAYEYEKLMNVCLNFHSIAENNPDTIYVTDGKGYVVYINQAYNVLAGVNRNDLLGINMRDLVGKTVSESGTLRVMRDRVECTITQVLLKTGRISYATSKPVFDDSGKISLIITSTRDITEIKELRDKLISKELQANEYRAQLELIKSQIINVENLVANDKKMLEILYIANKVAKVDTTILILGETGTGKEELSKYIHAASSRKDEAFVKINCGAIVETLIESELFGYEKGAFTGAIASGKAGLFETADKGTIFLDEIGELSLDMQTKLLRVLQEREIRRIGSIKPIKIDVRVIAATNKDLKQMVAEKRFREDLYYRLNVVSVVVPPLRERKDDIVPLAAMFLDEFNKKYNMQKKLTGIFCRALKSYSWPGNVRELRNVVEQAVILNDDDRIYNSSLSNDSLTPSSIIEDWIFDSETELDLKEFMDKIEKHYIMLSKDKFKSVRKAASYLKLTPTTYLRKLKKYEEESNNP